MPDALQLCPNDQAPFFHVCAGHAQALGLLGFRVRTVFFEARCGAEPSPDVDYATPREIPGLLGGERPALLVSHRHRAYRVGVRMARRMRIPTHIAVAHEFGMFARKTRRLRRRLAGRHHALFAAVSAPVAADLGTSGIDGPLVLPNVIDRHALRDTMLERAQARAMLGVPLPAFAIGVVGRLHPKKDPLRALRVFETYRRDDPGAWLVFLGDGPLRSRIEQHAGERIVLAGFRADARTLLGAFDLLLGCSTDREAFGVVVLEAMAAGVPVVVADRPGQRSVVGDCGTYFGTDDELVAALRGFGACDRTETVERARRRVAARFSVEALAERYREVLNAPQRGVSVARAPGTRSP
ncbi:MAG: glycosyltransferase [Gammaproteobacteria bacterium]|nr:glycosyltransferase [Gammaproteobacteria bacterium]